MERIFNDYAIQSRRMTIKLTAGGILYFKRCEISGECMYARIYDRWEYELCSLASGKKFMIIQ